MAEKSSYHEVVIPTLVTPIEMLSFPENRVKAYLLRQLPSMHRIVDDWHSSRPTMEQVFEVKRPYWWDYKKDMLTRQADCTRYAMGEASEFLRSVRTHEGIEKIKLEFGDVFFWLLLYDQAFDPSSRITVSHLAGNDSVSLDDDFFKHKASHKDRNMLSTLEGEMAVVMAVNLLQQQFSNDVQRRYQNISEERVYAYLDLAMLTLGRYALAQNWNLVDIIAQVAAKNEENYPSELFRRMSPFAHDVDAIDFLNVLRQPGRKRNYFAKYIKKHLPPEDMDAFQNLHPSEFPTGLVGRYRTLILELLQEVTKTSKDQINVRIAGDLIKTGQWDDVLLENYYVDPTDIY